LKPKDENYYKFANMNAMAFQDLLNFANCSFNLLFILKIKKGLFKAFLRFKIVKKDENMFTIIMYVKEEK
jgi:hypothetical protein